MAAQDNMKPYVKLASTLVVIGMALFSFERFGLGRLEAMDKGVHLDGTVLSLMVIAPVALIAAGAVVYVVGKIRRL